MFGNNTYTRCRTEIDLITDTCFFRHPFTTSDLKYLLDHFKYMIACGSGYKRAEIISVSIPSSGNCDPGKFIIRDLYKSKILGILQINIIFRLILFNNGVLKDQSLHFIIGNNKIDTVYPCNKPCGLYIQPFFLEIALYPLLKILGFPHI